MNTFRNLSLCILALVAVSFGQTTTVNTTLASPMGSRDTTVTLTSSTGVLAQGLNNQVMSALFIDREYMEVTTNVNSLGTGNTWNVRRNGTSAGAVLSPHLSGATVWVSAPGSLGVFDLGPNDRIGTCTSAAFMSLPLIETRTGNLVNCGSNGAYARFGNFGETSVGTAIAAATTIAPQNRVTHVGTSTTAIVNITVPPALPDGGTFTIIPDTAFTWTAAGDLSASGTAIVGKAIIFTYDKTTGKLYPSY